MQRCVCNGGATRLKRLPQAVRSHEVVDALVPQGAEVARALDGLVVARRWDIHRDPFEDEGHFAEYLDRTAGVLTEAAARALGAEEQGAAEARRLGAAGGLARFLAAIPALEAKGRVPGRPEAVKRLAEPFSTKAS